MTGLAPIGRDGAILEAVAIARRLGLRVDGAEILNARHDLVLWLRPAPVVARVAWITSLVRGPERARHSLGLAAFLDRAGEPVTRPTDLVDPGPHLGPSGCAVTLWQRLEVVDRPVDPMAIGHSLRRIHAIAREYPGPLMSLDPLGEAVAVARIAERFVPREAGRLLRAAAGRAMPDLPRQPIHGDAGFHNAFATPGGIVWGDWEECGVGPVEWDVATLTHRSRVLGERVDEISVAARAYGHVNEKALDLLSPILAIWAVAWGLLGCVRDGRPVDDVTRRRLAWVEGQPMPPT